MGERGRRCSATYIYMHMNTNDENIWIAIEDKDVWQDERRGLNVGAAERAGPCRRGGRRANDDDMRWAGVLTTTT